MKIFKKCTLLFLLILSLFQVVLAQQFYTSVGAEFPIFEKTDINGNEVSNRTLKGKPSLLIFFGTRCAPCLKELKELDQRLPNSWYKTFNIYAIGSTDDSERLLHFNSQREYKFKFIPDPNQELFILIADNTIPRTFLIDRNGIILSQTEGFYKTPFESLIARMEKLKD